VANGDSAVETAAKNSRNEASLAKEKARRSLCDTVEKLEYGVCVDAGCHSSRFL
jgi:hypothetical protein